MAEGWRNAVEKKLYALDKAVKKLTSMVLSLQQQENKIMATLADLQNEMTSMEAEVQAAVEVLRNLAANAPDPAAVTALADRLQAAHDSLKAAVDAASPPAPTP